MKLKLASIFIVVLFLSIGCGGNKPEPKFSFAPKTPKPGELITLRFNQDSTKLKDVKKAKVFVYFYDIDLIKTEELTLKNEDGVLKGTVTIPDSAKGLVAKITDEEGNIIDNNNNKGYTVLFYDNKGNVLPGTLAGLAFCYAEWGYNLEVETDRETAFELFNKEFAKNPNLKEKYLDTYLFLINRLNSAQAKELITKELAPYFNKTDLSEKVLTEIVKWLTTFKDPKAKDYEALLLQKYPQAEYFQSKKYQEFKEANLDKKIKLLDEFEKNYTGSEYLETMYGRVLLEKAQSKNVQDVKDFAIKNKSKIRLDYFYRVINLFTSSQDKKQLALELANLALEKAELDYKLQKDNVPNYSSKQEWEKSLNSTIGSAKYFLATTQKSLNIADAFKNFEEAYNLTLGKDPEINLAYSQELIAKKEFEKAQTVLEKDLKLGKLSEDGENVLKEAYNNNKKNSQSFENYISAIKAEANKELVAKIKANLINLPAPDFKLNDLEGKTVTLSEFKGKVVVIDFWATWCSPCLSSFPGMAKAVNKYANDKDVKFLFINVWERVDDKVANAKEFLKKNGYPFHILMDLDSKVVESYKVTGIPTKIFVDKNGNIRYKSVGFGGNTDEMVKEIETIINVIK